MKNRGRYYKNKKLATWIARLEHVPASERDRLLYGLMRLISSHGPELLDNFVMKFPLDPDRRNWYDGDPDHWLVINGLQYSGKKLQKAVTRYLEKEMREPHSRDASSYAASIQ